MDDLFGASPPPISGSPSLRPSKRDEVYAAKAEARRIRQTEQQPPPPHFHYGGDMYARNGSDRSVRLPAVRLPAVRGAVKAPYATQSDLPPAGRRLIDNAAAGALPGRGFPPPVANLTRWGSPRGERARRMEKEAQWPSLGQASPRLPPPPIMARAQEAKIKAGRERFGWDFQGRANEGVKFPNASKQQFVMGGQLPPISLHGARQDLEAHHARRQRERGAPWE